MGSEEYSGSTSAPRLARVMTMIPEFCLRQPLYSRNDDNTNKRDWGRLDCSPHDIFRRRRMRSVILQMQGPPPQRRERLPKTCPEGRDCAVVKSTGKSKRQDSNNQSLKPKMISTKAIRIASRYTQKQVKSQSENLHGCPVT